MGVYTFLLTHMKNYRWQKTTNITIILKIIPIFSQTTQQARDCRQCWDRLKNAYISAVSLKMLRTGRRVAVRRGQTCDLRAAGLMGIHETIIYHKPTAAKWCCTISWSGRNTGGLFNLQTKIALMSIVETIFSLQPTSVHTCVCVYNNSITVLQLCII